MLEINARWDAGPREGPRSGSLGELICQYRAAPEFKQLAPASRKNYEHFLGKLEEGFASKSVAKIDSAWVYKVRDA